MAKFEWSNRLRSDQGTPLCISCDEVIIHFVDRCLIRGLILFLSTLTVLYDLKIHIKTFTKKLHNQNRLFFYRTVCLPRTSLIQPCMFTGLVPLESTSAQLAANAGISLSTVLNVQLPCQLMVLCTCGKEANKIYTVSAILRGTVTTFTKARCA